jgi:hypothetical protein
MILVCSERSKAQLAQLDVDISTPGTWSYTITNLEPGGSPNYINAFTLAVGAPIQVTGTPDGWDFDVVTQNGQTYVGWFSADPQLPYPHDIAPGASLSGFQIQSTVTTSALLPYRIDAWDHDADDFGPFQIANVLAPSAVPAPPALWTMLLGTLPGAGLALRRRRVSRG